MNKKAHKRIRAALAVASGAFVSVPLIGITAQMTQQTKPLRRELSPTEKRIESAKPTNIRDNKPTGKRIKPTDKRIKPTGKRTPPGG